MSRRGRYLEARLFVAGGSVALVMAAWSALALHDLQGRSNATEPAPEGIAQPAAAQTQTSSGAQTPGSGAADAHTRSRAS